MAQMKFSPQGLLIPMALVPAFEFAISVDSENTEETPCRDCDLIAARGVMCGECSQTQAVREAWNALASAMEVAEQSASDKATDALSDARKAYKESA